MIHFALLSRVSVSCAKSRGFIAQDYSQNGRIVSRSSALRLKVTLYSIVSFSSRKVLAVVVSLVLFLSLTACGGGDNGQEAGAYTTAEDYADSLNFPGVMLVQKNGVDLVRKVMGYADKDAGVTNTVESRFRIASLTKAFTGLSIVQLKNTGLLDYDDTLSTYLPDFVGGDQVTVHHLLTHRSGVNEYVPLVDDESSYSPLELIDLVKGRPLAFQPGSEFRYTNSNYLLLGYIIELVTGSDYAAYIRYAITEPLAMSSTTYGASVITGGEYAKGYQDISQTHPARYLDMSIPYAAGALSSNLADMERWARSFLDRILVSEQDMDEIFKGDYGFGWGIRLIEGKRAYFHGGGIDGFSSMIVLFPEQEGIIIMLSNAEGVHRLFERLVDTMAAHEF